MPARTLLQGLFDFLVDPAGKELSGYRIFCEKDIHFDEAAPHELDSVPAVADKL